MREINREISGVSITGVAGNTEGEEFVERGHVYKDLDSALKVLTDEGSARVARRLYPAANNKGTD